MNRIEMVIPKRFQKRDRVSEHHLARKATSSFIATVQFREKHGGSLGVIRIAGPTRPQRHRRLHGAGISSRRDRLDLKKAFEDAKYMLLPDVYESADDRVSAVTLQRAMDFVRNYAVRSEMIKQKRIPAPRLENADGGAVDASWTSPDLVLTVRFPKDPGKPLLIYGRRGEIVLKNAIPASVVEELFLLNSIL